MLTDSPIFTDFVRDMVSLVEEAAGDETRILLQGRSRLAQLVASDAWLPPEYRTTHPERFTQYMLHRDVDKGFTVLCVAWGRGQYSSPHNHKTWGIIGQLHGAELTRTFEDPQPGQPLRLRSECLLRPGETTSISPSSGDVHDVRNVAEGASVSIHVYGADLARLASSRNRFDEATGAVIPFLERYH